MQQQEVRTATMQFPDIKQTGVSMVEVLVGLLLVSIVGFSVLAMSAFATQESNQLRQELTADYLARTLLSRMQANITPNTVSLYEFNSAVTSGPDRCDQGCTPADIARLDVKEWTSTAEAMLPNVRYRTWSDNGHLNVAIAWQGPKASLANQSCPLTISDNDTCRTYSAVIPI